MFPFSQDSMPVLPTCQALIVLDIVNDLISPNCPLPVEKPSGLVDNIINLSAEFRKNGKVMWVQSHFEEDRPINDGKPGSENVITNVEVQLAAENKNQSRKQKGLDRVQNPSPNTGASSASGNIAGNNETEDKYQRTPEDEETFLTVVNGAKPKLMLPFTSGVNYASSLVPFVKSSDDIFFSKSHYSAFRSGYFLQALRGLFVTEIFICGALSNISVYATAMDAARHGYQITLVSDCLGYRSQARHDETLRSLERSTGCDIITSEEVIELRQKKFAPAHPKRRKENPGRDNRSLRQLVGGIRASHRSSLPTSESSSSRSSGSASSLRSNHQGMEAGGSPASLRSNSSSRIRYTPSPKPVSNTEAGAISRSIGTTLNGVDNVSFAFDDDENDHAKGALDLTNPILEVDEDNESTAQYELFAQKNFARAAENSSTSTRVDRLPRSGTSAAQNSVKTRAEDSSEAIQKMLSAATQALQSISYKSPPEDAQRITAELSEAQIIESGGSSLRLDQDTATATTTATAESPTSTVDLPSATAYPPTDQDQTTAAAGPENYSIMGSTMLCEGDTEVVENLLPATAANTSFQRVRDEVEWQTMYHLGGEVPRLVAVQGEIGKDGSIPVYRHPSDESPPLLRFSPAVSEIKDHLEKVLGHKVNHCLIQFYRDGTDYISEHSDKTLDIDRHSYIANVSLGATRTMTFRTKRASKIDGDRNEQNVRQTVKAPLPHNSLCKVGLSTNAKWLHSIRADKRRQEEKSSSELAFNSQRISLTFRLISTYLTADQKEIYGQGATSKSATSRKPVINGHCDEAVAMINAMGFENQSSDFDWTATYGSGFDVLHMTNMRKLHLGRNATANTKIRLMLNDYNLPHTIAPPAGPVNFSKLQITTTQKMNSNGTNDLDPKAALEKDREAHMPTTNAPMKFIDNNAERSVVDGDMAIMLYIETFYGLAPERAELTKAGLAKHYSRFQRATEIGRMWDAKIAGGASTDANAGWRREFVAMLGVWDGYCGEHRFVAGDVIGLADFAFWPVLNAVVVRLGWEGLVACGEGKMAGLRRYWEEIAARESAKCILEEIEDSVQRV